VGAVDWRAAEDDVRRLRQRIFTASQAGDLKRVRNLQKLMLRSRANTLVSVRRVAERNAGRVTAGIDGERALTSSAKAALAVEVHRERTSWQAVRAGVFASRKRMGSSAHSGFRCCVTGPCRPVSSTRWNRNGKHGSNRGPTDSVRAAAVTTRSRPSTGR